MKFIGLEASMLIGKNFIDVWLSEGKFRKLILAWPNLKQMASEEPNYITVVSFPFIENMIQVNDSHRVIIDLLV